MKTNNMLFSMADDYLPLRQKYSLKSQVEQLILGMPEDIVDMIEADGRKLHILATPW